MEIQRIIKCKWLIEEICVNDNSPYLADYPYPFCECRDKKCCEYFEKEDGKLGGE